MSTASYTDNNVVYTYTVPNSGNTGTAFVDVSPSATGVINIRSSFIQNSVTYTVTSIGQDAFFGNVLESVTIPNTVITIDTNAFKNTGLSAISIPDSVTSIGDSAFANNKIATTNIGNNVVTIGPNAFLANKLTTITIPDKVVTIGASAFQNNALNNVTIIGTEVTTINASAFQGNNLSEVFIPVSVASIGNSAFRTNQINKVYFFNIPTFQSNAFANNNLSLTAFYVDTSTTDKINSLPVDFTTKTPMTKIEILKYQIQQGVTVQYLLDDYFTLAEMIAADGSANWLLTYYTLQQLVDANMSIEKLLLGTTVTPLALFNCGVSIVALKNAQANTKVMLNQFSLPALITAEYTVSELKSASESIIAPVVTNDNKVAIDKFKLAGANVLQMLGSYTLSALIGADYRVSVLLAADSTISLGNFVGVNTSLWDLMNSFSISALISYPFSVAQLITASELQDNGVYKVTDTTKQALGTKAGTLKSAGALINQMVNAFTLTELISAGYTVSELKVAKPLASVTDFKEANAVVTQMLGSYTLAQLLVDADYRVAVLRAADSTITLDTFYSSGAKYWDLMNNYSLSSLINTYMSVAQLIYNSELKDSNNNYLVTDTAKQDLGTKAGTLKAAGAYIGQMVDAYTLAALIAAGYTVSELKYAIPSASASDFKAANAVVTQMLGSFSLSELISANYRVAVLLAADSTLGLTNFVGTGAYLWDLMNNYSLLSLVSYPFSVADLITASNLQDNGVYRVTDIAKQALGTKPGALKGAGAPIAQMIVAYTLPALIAAGYTVSELKAVIPLASASDFKAANAVVTQMLGSFSLSELISADYRVAVLRGADSTLGLTDFVGASAPLWDLMNNYSLPVLISYPFSVANLIDASKLQDNGVYRVTDTAKQSLGTKAGTLKDAGANTSQMLGSFLLSDLIAADYRVSVLLAANSTLELTDFVGAGAYLWDLMNNYSLLSLVSYPFSVADLITASKLQDNGVYKVTDTTKQALDTKAGTLKAAGANIKEMMNAFSLTDLISAGYKVADLIVASDDTNAPTVDADRKVSIPKFKNASAPLTEMMNSYSLNDLFYYGYTVVDIINASNEKVSDVFVVTDTDKQALDTKPKILKDAGAPTTEMLNYFILTVLLNSPVSYTVAELKAASNSNDVLSSNKVTVAKFKTAFASIGTNLDTSLASMFGSYSLEQLTPEYTVEELVSYDPTLTIAQLYNASANVSQMISYFTLGELISANIYSVSTFVNNGKYPQMLIDAGMPLWKMLNEYGTGVGYLRQANSISMLTIAQLLNAVSDINTISMFKTLIVTDFYIGNGASSTIPDHVDTPTSTQITERDYDIFNNATLVLLLKVRPYSVTYIINTGNDVNVTNISLKNLVVQNFIDAANLDAWIYDNRLANFIDYFSLADLVNNWSVHDLLYRGTSSFLSRIDKIVTLEKLKQANAPVWDMLNNFDLSVLVIEAGYYTSSELVTASSDSRVTRVANKNISLTSMINAGALLYDLMNYFPLSELVAVPYSVTELINASKIKDYNNNYFVTKTIYQQLNTKVATLKVAGAVIGQMIAYFTLSELIAGGYSVNELKTANPDYTVQGFKEALAPTWEILNNYPLGDFYDFYTITELRNASANDGITVSEYKNLTIPVFKSSSPPAPIWMMLNAYTLSALTPYYTADELVFNSGFPQVTNAPNKNLTPQKLKDANENLWDIMNSGRFGILDLLDVGYTITDLRNEIALKDADDNYLVTNPYFRENFTIREIYTVFSRGQGNLNPNYYFYLAQVINEYDLVNIIKDNDGEIFPISQIIQAQREYSNYINANKAITPLRLATAIKTYQASEQQYYIYHMSQAYGGSSKSTLDIMLAQARFKPIDLVTGFPSYYYDNLVDTDNNPSKAIDFKTAGSTYITVSDMYDTFPLAQLLSAYTISEVLTVNNALTYNDFANTLTDYYVVNFQIYYTKIVNDLVALVKNGTFPLSDVFNSYTYISDPRYISASKFKDIFTVKQLKDAGVNTTDMLYSYYMTEYNNNLSLDPPQETSISGLDALLKEYTVSELMAIEVNISPYTFYWPWLSVKLLKDADANISQMINYFNHANFLDTGVDGLTLLLEQYTVLQLISNSDSTTDLSIARLKTLHASISQMLTAFNTGSSGLADLLVSYTVSELNTANNHPSIADYKAASADISEMLTAFNTGSSGLADLLVSYTVSELNTANNHPSISAYKAASASISQMLTAFNTGSSGLASLLLSYTVSELNTANNHPSIAAYKAASASISQMLTAFNTSSSGLASLLVSYTVAELNTALNYPSIAEYKAAPADIWQMLTNYILSDLVTAGYTSSELVTASSDSRITRVANKNISLTSMISAGAPLYDLMNFYTLTQLIAVPYSVSALITASNLKVSGVYKVTVTDYQELDKKASTFKAANALIGQMIAAFSLADLITADYRVQIIKTNSSYTVADFKAASAPIWDMLNRYTLDDLLQSVYKVAELLTAVGDNRLNFPSMLYADSFVEVVIRHPNWTYLAADILNNFSLYDISSPSGWRVDILLTYSADVRVTRVDNQNYTLNDFKTRSRCATWDILLNYTLAQMVTGGYTVAELKTTIPYNGSIPLNKRVTIATLKAAGSMLSDIINNYTLRELVDESLSVGSYTLTQMINTSNSTTAVPLVIDSHKVTLARLLSLSPVPPLTYLLTYYTTLQLVGGGVSPLSLANVNPTILEDVVAIGYEVKLTTPRLLGASITSGVVALSLSQAVGSDVAIDKYFISYSSNNGRTFTPLTKLMDTTRTPNVPQLGNTLYIYGLEPNKFYSFRVMASSGSVNSPISNTLKNIFLG